MKVTKEQKVFIGLLAVGLIALGVDRFVLSSGTAEAADDSASLLVAKAPAAKGAPAPAPAANAKAPLTSPTTNPVAQKLNALSDTLHLSNAPIRDAFAPPLVWTEKPGMIGSTGKTFEQSHQLSGVMVSGRHPAAMIDGKLVSVGQTVDGYKLVSVSQGTAVFQFGETTVTLHSR